MSDYKRLTRRFRNLAGQDDIELFTTCRVGIERLAELEDKIEQGLLFELPYEPKRLIWGKGDDELLCPECLSDVMGGFAIESNNPLLQCPRCGCFIDNYNKPPIDWEETEARLKELQGK